MKKLRFNEQRAKTATILVWICGGFTLLSMISTIFEYILLNDISNGVQITMDQANANDLRQLAISLIRAAFFIASTVTFIMWFRRSYYNQEIKFGNMNSSNGWTAGAWFIPIMNLFKPYQLMKELYFNAEFFVDKHKLLETKAGRIVILGWWWALWIVVNMSQNAINRISRNAEQLSTLKSLSIASIIVDVIYILLVFLAVKVIRNYNELEVAIINSSDDLEQNIAKNSELLDASI
jgi:hypothetical protein